MAEQTLVLVKPDGVQRGLVGEVITRLERRGLKLVGMKLMQVSDELARQHYGEHVDRPFFGGLVQFITSSPIVAMAWEANNAAEIVRNTLGQTNPRQFTGRHHPGRPGHRHWPQPGARFRQPGVGRAGGKPVLPS